ncbi:Uncharacterised protein [Bordetella pertussis]|nr:Uncharacterised protein [Bordetella pertussis]
MLDVVVAHAALHHPQHHARVEAAGPGAHRQALERGKAHGAVDAAAIDHGAGRNAVAQVGGHDLAAGDLGQRAPQALRDVLVRQAVETVAPHALLVQVLGQRVAVGQRRVGAVEGRVEAGHLRDVRPALADHADGRKVVGLVQRRQRGEIVQLRQHVVVDQHRRIVLGAAMHHAVTDGAGRAAQVAAEPGAQHFLGARHVGRVRGRHVALEQGVAVLGADAQVRARPADAVELAAQGGPQLVALGDLVQVELEAGAAGVDDEKIVAHGRVLRRRRVRPGGWRAPGGGRRGWPPRTRPGGSGRCRRGWSGRWARARRARCRRPGRWPGS